MTVIDGIIQGLIQGLSEFLPISSSGHLSIFQHFFGLHGENAVIVNIFLHLGTLIAVFIAFWGKIKALIIEFFRLCKDIFTGKFKWKEMNPERRMIFMIVISTAVLAVFLPFKGYLEDLQSDASIIAEGIGFLYTAALLFLSTGKLCNGNKLTCGDVTVTKAVSIGIFQGIALVPGISRSGSTISAGLFNGLKREDAVEYSFILGIPVIIASALMEILGYNGEAINEIAMPIAVGFITAAISGYLAIRLIKLLVVSDKFRLFAYYTLILGIIILSVGVYESVSGNIVTFAST